MKRTLAFLALVGLAAPRSFGAAENPTRQELAGAVIRSDRWRIRRDLGQEEFEGNVSYRNEGQAFRADWALWDRKRRTFETRGRSYVSRQMPDGELLESWAHEGRYDFAADLGRATSGEEPVRFRRTAPGADPLNGLSRKASWDGPSKTLSLEEAVEMRGSSETARADRADYLVAERRLRLSGGRPVLEFQGESFDAALQADAVDLLPDSGRAQAQGRVRGWAHFDR